MALRKEGDNPQKDITERFFTAQNNRQSSDTEEKKLIQSIVQEQVVRLAQNLDIFIVDSREKSIALTKLEEVLMWSGKAIFKEED